MALMYGNLFLYWLQLILAQVKLILSGLIKAKLGTVREPRAIICPSGEIQEWRGHMMKV